MTRRMPAFVFLRRHDIERADGYALAGTLIIDVHKDAPLGDREGNLLTDIGRELAATRAMMTEDAIIFGWPDKTRPPDADEIMEDHEALTDWAADRLTLAMGAEPLAGGGLEYVEVEPIDRQLFLPRTRQ